MLKKAFFLSLVLLLIAAAMISWVLAEQKEKKQLLRQQMEKLNAESAKLDKLIAGEIDAHSFSKVVPGEDWQQELSRYKAQEETRLLVLNASIACASMGGAILSWCLLLWTARLIIKGSSNLTSFSANFIRHLRRARGKQQTKTCTEEDEKVSERKQQPDKQQSQLEKYSEVLKNSGWQSFDGNYANRHSKVPTQTGPLASNKPWLNQSAKDAGKVAVLLADEKSVKFERPLKTTAEGVNVNKTQPKHPDRSVQKAALPDSHESSQNLEGSLRVYTENLEKQVAEFKQMAQAVKQTAIEHSEPLNNTLLELTQQVAAIREYASQQQERVEKLQDGYDWNIIKNFCLRIIRCIDNLEDRISQLSEQNSETTDLQQVRDELVFALESSGVEQFEPEINSDYRGREKDTEAVKDRQCSDDPTLTGKIAKVIKPGYQYVIDDENVKIVRTAQVKLFG